ncbi:MAG: endonuclease domain-containing protein [Candidatus Hermodarchaeota archaeon]
MNSRREYLKQFCKSKYEEFFVDSAPSKLLDLFETQVVIGQYTVDFAVEKYKIAIECDNILLDYKAPDEKRSDLRKTKFLIDNGWTVFRFTAQAIFSGAIVCHRMIADEIMKYEPKIMDVKDFLSDNDTNFLKVNFSEIEIITSGTFEKETKKFDRRNS